MLRSLRPVLAGTASIAVAVGVVLGLSGCVGAPPITTIGQVEFDMPLPIPALAESRVDEHGTRVFALDAQSGTSDFLPGVETPTQGFNQPYLGPTLVAEAGETVAVDITN